MNIKQSDKSMYTAYKYIFIVGKSKTKEIKSEVKKWDTFKNWPIIKNLQFLSYPHETWWKWLTHEVIIVTKFLKDRTKIVEYL